MGGVQAEEIGFHGRPASLPLTLPPLACLYLKPKEDAERRGINRGVAHLAL
jgi:hypothetical protein